MIKLMIDKISSNLSRRNVNEDGKEEYSASWRREVCNR